MTCILVGAVCLPGCAVVGPLLSVGGMAGLAPLHYASTAYTLGEFTYEFATNDKDPGEVIRAKVEGFVSGDAFALPGGSGSPDARPGFDSPAPLPDAMLATRSRVGAGEGDAVPAATDPVTLASADAASMEADAATLSGEVRPQRTEQLLARRSVQYERLEARKMLFRQAHARGQLSLRQTAMASSPNLVIGAMGETSLRQ